MHLHQQATVHIRRESTRFASTTSQVRSESKCSEDSKAYNSTEPEIKPPKPSKHRNQAADRIEECLVRLLVPQNAWSSSQPAGAGVGRRALGFLNNGLLKGSIV